MNMLHQIIAVKILGNANWFLTYKIYGNGGFQHAKAIELMCLLYTKKYGNYKIANSR